MTVFILYTQVAWGKGKTFTEALESLRKAGKEEENEFYMSIYEAKDFDEIYINEFSEIHGNKGDKLLYKSKKPELI